MLKSAVTEERLELPDGFSIDAASEIIKNQHLVPLAYQGAVNCGISKEMPFMKQMLKKYYQNLIRSEKQMRAVTQIFQAFDEKGIDYMPVKGCNMKRLYCFSGPRSSGKR